MKAVAPLHGRTNSNWQLVVYEPVVLFSKGFLLSLTHTSTTTHLSTNSNIFTKLRPIELKLRICSLGNILSKIVVFFKYKVAGTMTSKNRPLSRRPTDDVSEL